MRIWTSLSRVLLCYLSACLSISCFQSVQFPVLFLGIHQQLGLRQNSSINSSTVQSLSSIQVLGAKKKEPSTDVLLAMKQCESAILKPKNDQMMKGPSFCLGLLKQSFGDLSGALDDYERAVLRFPANSAANFNAAGILENMGRDLDAAGKYKLAMAVPEMCESSLSKLIPLLLRNGLDDEAKQICIEMTHGPHLVRYKAFECLGATLFKMKKFSDALSAYESALAICDDSVYSSETSERRFVEALNNAAQAASKISAHDRKGKETAEKYHLKSIQIAPDNADSHSYYGIFLKYENRNEEAKVQFQTALSLDPKEMSKETGYAAVQLASISGGSSQKEMNKEYISGLFDGYADRFDEELCKKLEYKGHEQVVSALIKYLKTDIIEQTAGKLGNTASVGSSLSKVMELNIIDIGCGTGLCGPLIREQQPTALISGVDLSQRMLEKCVFRGCYNSLILGDAVEFLESVMPSSVDSIIAADVFIYVGDLNKILKSSYNALKEKNSFLIFTIEEMIIDTVESVIPNFDKKFDNGFQLRECGRFSHSEKYVRDLAHELGFDVISSEKQFIRLQSEIPVRSITFVLSKR